MASFIALSRFKFAIDIFVKFTIIISTNTSFSFKLGLDTKNHFWNIWLRMLKIVFDLGKKRQSVSSKNNFSRLFNLPFLSKPTKKKSVIFFIRPIIRKPLRSLECAQPIVKPSKADQSWPTLILCSKNISLQIPRVHSLYFWAKSKTMYEGGRDYGSVRSLE